MTLPHIYHLVGELRGVAVRLVGGALQRHTCTNAIVYVTYVHVYTGINVGGLRTSTIVAAVQTGYRIPLNPSLTCHDGHNQPQGFPVKHCKLAWGWLVNPKQ